MISAFVIDLRKHCGGERWTRGHNCKVTTADRTWGAPTLSVQQMYLEQLLSSPSWRLTRGLVLFGDEQSNCLFFSRGLASCRFPLQSWHILPESESERRHRLWDWDRAAWGGWHTAQGVRVKRLPQDATPSWQQDRKQQLCSVLQQAFPSTLCLFQLHLSCRCTRFCLSAHTDKH